MVWNLLIKFLYIYLNIRSNNTFSLRLCYVRIVNSFQEGSFSLIYIDIAAHPDMQTTTDEYFL